MATRKPTATRTTTRKTAARPAARSAAPPRPRSPAKAKAKAPPKNAGAGWRRQIDPARVAFIAVLVAVALSTALLLDVYLGQNDPVHVLMVTAFGPLACLVPVGAGVLAVDFYRRHEGRPPWLHFEESCGAALLFVSTLTFSSFCGLASSLVGNSISDELRAVIGQVGALFAVLALIAIGAVLAFHVTAAQLARAYRLVARAAIAAGRTGHSLGRRWSAGRAKAAVPAAATGRKRRDRRAGAADHDTFAGGEQSVSLSPLAPVLPASLPAPVIMQQLPSLEEMPAPPDFGSFGADDDLEDEPLPEPASPSWPAPELDLLDAVPPALAAPANNDARARIIEETLRSFNVDADVVDVQAGPTVTQFGLRPASGVRVQRITALSNDLALALAAPSIRIEAPVPGKPVVGIEIPNATTALVTLREILESEACQKMRSPLKIALGKNVSGEPVMVDLARMPHLLIAGATGSGKSVCLNSLIACLLFHNSPDRLRLLMIDPKMVELTTFNGVPHLLHPVVTELDKVGGTLKWTLKEMHRRYKLFGEAGVRNVARYNEVLYERVQQGEPSSDKNKPLPYIVLIIDELADLMMVSPAEVEESISRLAALARATGIHIVLATQRPSVDVITGVIKANFPARIAFAVSSQVDSRVIIDQAGAEKLMGRGDMLYLPSDGSKAVRVQGTYLSDQEIEKLVEFWSHNAPFTPEQIASGELEAPKDGEGEAEASDDKLLSEAGKVVREYRRASVSLLQRRLSVGYSRAARLLDQLEEHGVVGPSEDGRSRVVLDTEDGDAEPVADAAVSTEE